MGVGVSTSGGSNSLSNDGRARRTLTTETNSNVNSSMGVGSNNGSITRSNYLVNDVIAGGTSNVSRENNGSSLRSSTILERPYTMAQRIVTSDTLIPSPSNNNQMTAAALALSDPSPVVIGGNNGSMNPYRNRTFPGYKNGVVLGEKPISPFVQVPEPVPDIVSPPTTYCLNPSSEVNGRLDTQVEVRVYPCNNSQGGSSGKKKFTQFMVKPEGVIIQGTNRRSEYDLGSEYSRHIGRKLTRYELADSRACQLLVTTHGKSFYVVPAPEAFSRHSGTCRLLGDRKHPPTPHTLQVGDFLRVGSVGVVVIETHDGIKHKALSEEKIQRIMKDTASGGFVDLGETDGENSEASLEMNRRNVALSSNERPICYMCFDDCDDDDNPLITPCKCLGDTRYVHVGCLRKWHTAEADNEICFLSSVDATCSVCKSTFKSDFKLRNGKTVKLFKSSLEPPYISLLVATKHEMAQRLFNTRFQLSFSTLLKPDKKNSTRALLLGRSSGSDMVLDYRTVSARHASLRFKNSEFIFCDAGSSNGSYLYLRRPVELTNSNSVQFRLGRSMISMKVVNKWNRRFLRAVRRTTHSSTSCSSSNNSSVGANNNTLGSSNYSGTSSAGAATHGYYNPDEHSIGSEEDSIMIFETNDFHNHNKNSTDTNEAKQKVGRSIRTRESIMSHLPPPGQLHQTSSQHLELLYALAYPKRATLEPKKLPNISTFNPPPPTSAVRLLSNDTTLSNTHDSNTNDMPPHVEEKEEEILLEIDLTHSSLGRNTLPSTTDDQSTLINQQVEELTQIATAVDSLNLANSNSIVEEQNDIAKQIDEEEEKDESSTDLNLHGVAVVELS